MAKAKVFKYHFEFSICLEVFAQGKFGLKRGVLIRSITNYRKKRYRQKILQCNLIFLPIGLWRKDEADLFVRTFWFVINKRNWKIYNYHKGKRRTLPYSSFPYDFGFSNKIGSPELLKDVSSYNTLETSWKKDNSRSDHSDQVWM